MSDNSEQTYKIGGGAVGKSSLAIRFVKNQFVADYNPTIEDSYRKAIQVDDSVAVIEVLDTAGQEEYSAMRSQWIRYGEGFCIIYSITSSNSFETLDKEINPLLTRLDTTLNEISSLGPSLPLALFGNKSDLASQRQVSEEQGREMANKLGATFFEGSAKQCINVNETFFSIVRAIRIDRKGEKQIFQPPTNTNATNDNGVSGSQSKQTGKRTMDRLCYLF